MDSNSNNCPGDPHQQQPQHLHYQQQQPPQQTLPPINTVLHQTDADLGHRQPQQPQQNTFGHSYPDEFGERRHMTQQENHFNAQQYIPPAYYLPQRHPQGSYYHHSNSVEPSAPPRNQLNVAVNEMIGRDMNTGEDIASFLLESERIIPQQPAAVQPQQEAPQIHFATAQPLTVREDSPQAQPQQPQAQQQQILAPEVEYIEAESEIGGKAKKKRRCKRAITEEETEPRMTALLVKQNKLLNHDEYFLVPKAYQDSWYRKLCPGAKYSANGPPTFFVQFQDGALPVQMGWPRQNGKWNADESKVLDNLARGKETSEVRKDLAGRKKKEVTVLDPPAATQEANPTNDGLTTADSSSSSNTEPAIVASLSADAGPSAGTSFYARRAAALAGERRRKKKELKDLEDRIKELRKDLA